MHKVPPTFFLEAVRFREPPFWRHKTLRPLEEYRSDSVAVATRPVAGRDEDPDLGAEVDDGKNEGGSANEEDEEEEVGTYQHDGCTIEEALMDEIKLIEEFTAGLKHQTQFRDGRLLNALPREGAGYRQGKEDELDKGFNLVNVGQVNKQCDVFATLLMEAHEAAYFDNSNRRLRIHVIVLLKFSSDITASRLYLEIDKN